MYFKGPLFLNVPLYTLICHSIPEHCTRWAPRQLLTARTTRAPWTPPPRRPTTPAPSTLSPWTPHPACSGSTASPTPTCSGPRVRADAWTPPWTRRGASPRRWTTSAPSARDPCPRSGCSSSARGWPTGRTDRRRSAARISSHRSSRTRPGGESGGSLLASV